MGINELPSLEEALATLEPKRRGRKPGSKNKPKVVEVEIPTDVQGFLNELEELTLGWTKGPDRPILYDFEVAQAILALIKKHGL